jgi:hypothetical protein
LPANLVIHQSLKIFPFHDLGIIRPSYVRVAIGLRGYILVTFSKAKFIQLVLHHLVEGVFLFDAFVLGIVLLEQRPEVPRMRRRQMVVVARKKVAGALTAMLVVVPVQLLISRRGLAKTILFLVRRPTLRLSINFCQLFNRITLVLIYSLQAIFHRIIDCHILIHKFNNLCTVVCMLAIVDIFV